MKPATSAPPWQPLTFGGVAAFARGTLGQLLRVQICVTLLQVSVLGWFVFAAWLPALQQLLVQLPGEAHLEGGRLSWGGRTPVVLGETPFLGLAFRQEATSSPGTTADLDVLLTTDGIRITSLFGYVFLHYPEAWTVDLSQRNTIAWWKAWRRAFFVGLLAGTFVLLLLGGWVQGLVAAWPTLLLGRLLRRELAAKGAWLLSTAAGLPASLVVAITVLLYGMGQLPLLGMLLGAASHFVVLAVYLGLATTRLPRRHPRGGRTANPFHPNDSAAHQRRSKNPFANSG